MALNYLSGRVSRIAAGIPGVSTSGDLTVSISGALGIETFRPRADADVPNISIRGNLVDAAQETGGIGYYLSQDADGVKWVETPPIISNAIFVFDNDRIVGLGSFTGLNFFTGDDDELIQVTEDPNNPNIAKIFVEPRWVRNTYNNNNSLSTSFGSDGTFWSLPGYGTSQVSGITSIGIGTNQPQADIQVGIGSTGVQIYGEEGRVEAEKIVAKDIEVDGNIEVESLIVRPGIATIAFLEVENDARIPLEYVGFSSIREARVTQLFADNVQAGLTTLGFGGQDVFILDDLFVQGGIGTFDNDVFVGGDLTVQGSVFFKFLEVENANVTGVITGKSGIFTDFSIGIASIGVGTIGQIGFNTGIGTALSLETLDVSGIATVTNAVVGFASITAETVGIATIGQSQTGVGTINVGRINSASIGIATIGVASLTGQLYVAGISTLAGDGGITTTGGDLYVGNDLFVAGDTEFGQIFAQNILVSGATTSKTLDFAVGFGTTATFTEGNIGVASIGFAGIETASITSIGATDVSITGVATINQALVTDASIANLNGNNISYGIGTISQLYAGIITGNNLAYSGVSTIGPATFTSELVSIGSSLDQLGKVTVGVSKTISPAGIVTTRGDMYVGEDLYVNGDTTFKQIFAENIEVSGVGTIKNLNYESGIGTDLTLVQGRIGVATIGQLVGAAASIIEGKFIDLKVVNRSDLNLVYINSGITTTQVTTDLTVTDAAITREQVGTSNVQNSFVQTGVTTDLTVTTERVGTSTITRLDNGYQTSGISSIGIATIGNLTVTGITTFDGVVDINKVEFVELSVTGVSSINELFVNTGVATDFTIETERVGVSSIGLASITKAEVTSLESFDNKLSYVDIGYDRTADQGSFKRTGVGTIVGFTTVTGSVFIDGDLTVTGIATYDQLNAEQSQIGILTVFTALDASDAISSFKDTTVERNLEVIGISTIGLSTIANGDININRNLTVNGITTFFGTVNIQDTEYVNINVTEKATINDLDFNVGFGTELRADLLDAGITTSVFLDVTDTANIQTGIVTNLSVTRQDVVYNETGITTIGYANIANENVGVSTIGILSATDVTVSGGGTFQGDVDFEARLEIKEAYIQQAGIGTLFYQLGIGTFSQLGVASVGLASITEAQITVANVYSDNVAISSIVRAEIQDEFTERAYIDNLYYQVGLGTYSQLGVASVGLASITTAEVTTANVFTVNANKANVQTGFTTDAFIDNLYYEVGVGTYSQLGVASVGLASITKAEVTTARVFTANIDNANVETGFTTDSYIDNLYYEVGVGTFSQLGVASVGLASITTAEITTANVYRENVAISSVGFATIGYGNTEDGSFYRVGVGTIVGLTTYVGNVFIDGNLAVTGISSVEDIGADRALIGILTVFDYIDNRNDLFTRTLESRENTSIAGLTTVTGITTISGFTGISGQLEVDGTTQVTGVATIAGVTFKSGNLNVPGISTFVGFTTFNNSVSIANDLTVSRDLAVTGTSSFTGLASFRDSVVVDVDIIGGRNLVIPGIATVGTLKATFGEIDVLFGTDVEFSTARIGFATITQSETQVAAIGQAFINSEVVGISTITNAIIDDLQVNFNAQVDGDLDVLGTGFIRNLRSSTGDVNLSVARINVGIITSATISTVDIRSGDAVLQSLVVDESTTGTGTISTVFIESGEADLQFLNVGVSTLGIASIGYVDIASGEADLEFLNVGVATISDVEISSGTVDIQYIDADRATIGIATIAKVDVESGEADLEFLAAGIATIATVGISSGAANLDFLNVGISTLGVSSIGYVDIASGEADLEFLNVGVATVADIEITSGDADLQFLNVGISTLGIASIGYVDIASGEADLEFLNVGIATIANIGISSGSADLQLINVDRINAGFASITEIDVESGQADLEFLDVGIATVGFATITNLQSGVTTTGPLTVNGLTNITGDTTINGTLGVTSSVTITDNLSIGKTTVTNDLVVLGLADIERADIQLGLATNFFIVTGTIATATVETSNTGFGSFGYAPGFANPGPSTERGSFYRTGIGTIVGFTTITGDLFIDGDLDVTGFTSFTKIAADQAIIGIATFNDAVINKGTLEVVGIATVGSLNVAGNAELFSLEVTTNTALRGDLSVDGNIYSIGAANTFTQNVEIQGNLDVDGETNLGDIVRIQGSNPLSGILTVSNVVNTDRLIARTRIDTPTINASTGNITDVNGTNLFFDTATITDIDAVDINTNNLGVANNADFNKVVVTGLSTFIGLATFTNDLYAKDVYVENTARATNVIASANVQGESATFTSAGIDEISSTYIDTVNLRVVGFATINDAEISNIEVGFATAIGGNIGDLTVTGLTSTKDLTVTDTTSLFNLTVNDFLTVKGATTLEQNVRIDGNLELFGSADMLEVDVRNLRVSGVATVVGPFEAGSIINNGDLDQTGIATFRSGIEIATGNLDIITGDLNAVTGVITNLSGENLIYEDIRALDELVADKDITVNRNARIVGVLTATDLRITNDALVGNLYSTGIVSATSAFFDELTVNDSLTTKDFEFTGVGIGSELDLDRISADTGDITVLTGFGVTFEEGTFSTKLETRDFISSGIASLNTVTAETITATDVAVVNNLNFNVGVGTDLELQGLLEASEAEIAFAQVGILTATLRVEAGIVTATTVNATTVNSDFVNAKESIKLDDTFEILEFEVTGSGPTDILFVLDSLDYASFDVTVTAFSGSDVMSTKMHGVTLTGIPCTVLHNEYSTVASNGEFVEYDISPSGRQFALTADNSTSGNVTYRVRAELTLRP